MPSTTAAMRCPSTSGAPLAGVSASRLRKPVSMSRASSVAALEDEKRAPWTNGIAIAKSRYVSPGKPGSRSAGERPFAITARKTSGKKSAKKRLPGWWRMRTMERRVSWATFASQRLTRARPRPPRSRPRPRPRACGRSSRGRRRRASARAAAAARPRSRRRRARARRRQGRTSPARSTAAVPGCAAVASPKRRRVSAASPSCSGSAGATSTVGRPISALSAAGVPSATIRPRWMIPTRSARTSASSRYCVVRKTVTPSSRARRATSVQRALRLCGSRPVVGSSRKRIEGPWTSASARSRRRFIPPE